MSTRISLGATESLICIPFLTTMLDMPPERRTAFGVKPNTVRLSVGIEPIAELLADLDQALGRVRRRPTGKRSLGGWRGATLDRR